MTFLRDLKIGQKLALVVAVMSAPVAVLVLLFVNARNVQIDMAEREVAGLQAVRPLRRVLENLPAHRASAKLNAAGDRTARERMFDLQRAIDKDLVGFETAWESFAGSLRDVPRFVHLKSRWREIKEELARLSPEESAQAHAAALGELTSVVRAVSDQSGLALDPELDSHFLIDAATDYLPRIVETIAAAEAVGLALLDRSSQAADATATADARQNLARMAGQLDIYFGEIERGAGVAFERNPELKAKLTAPLAQNREGIRSFVEFAQDSIARAGRAYPPSRSGDAARFAEAAGDAAAASFALQDAALANLETSLGERIAALKSEKYLQLSIAVFVLAFTIALALYIRRAITEQIGEINALFDRISVGDLAARAQVRSDDELGRMTASLNRVLDNTLTLVQSSEERDAIQRSIEKLLDEIAGVAEGDLTKEAEVTAEVTGAIADSFNYMIAELRGIIAQVQHTTLQVSAAANQIQRTAEELATGSERQSSQILDATSSVDEMAQSIQHVSANALSAARVAQEALENARHGAEAVTQTMEGMAAIRGQVQETARRIKRLGESSLEIGEIVQLIGDIADRTSILALNASIQASAAGEESRGFAVVAEEVESLAERAAESAKRIDALIKTIQRDTNEAVAAMEDTTREVVGGSKLAVEAGRKLDQIENVSVQLASLLQSISESSRLQARGSESVVHAMGDISQVTRRTADGARHAAGSIRSLAALADELRNSVSRFKVPAQVRAA